MSIGSGGCIEKLRDKIHKQKGQKTKRQATIGESTKKQKYREKKKKHRKKQTECRRNAEIKWERKRFDGTKKLG